jgi:hypothetical protein
MTKENAAQFLPLVQALADGKTVEFNDGTDVIPKWGIVTDPTFAASVEYYRIKPEPREWKAFVMIDTPENRRHDPSRIGSLMTYDIGDEGNPKYQVIKVREILD